MRMRREDCSCAETTAAYRCAPAPRPGRGYGVAALRVMRFAHLPFVVQHASTFDRMLIAPVTSRFNDAGQDLHLVSRVLASHVAGAWQ